jgi:hypothetical protein
MFISVPDVAAPPPDLRTLLPRGPEIVGYAAADAECSLFFLRRTKNTISKITATISTSAPTAAGITISRLSAIHAPTSSLATVVSLAIMFGVAATLVASEPTALTTLVVSATLVSLLDVVVLKTTASVPLTPVAVVAVVAVVVAFPAGTGVGCGVGAGVGEGVGEEVVAGVGEGIVAGVGEGVVAGVGEGVGDGVGEGVTATARGVG